MMTESIMALVGVAVIWGVTNPLMKMGSVGIESVKRTNVVQQFFGELAFLMLNWKYLIPFLINQSGSVLYYWTLGNVDLSVAVPITNSLTFIFTTVAGHFLGEKISNKSTFMGMLLVCAGITLCLMAKSSEPL